MTDTTNVNETKETKEQEYKTVELSGLEIQYRKWKVREKLDLDKVDLNSSLDTIQRQLEKRKIFVYNCLKEPVLLDIEQYNYVLSLIREYSLHTPLEFTLECHNCKTQFLQSLSTPEIISYRDANYKDISVGGKTFKLGNLTDPNYDFDILNSNSTAERYLVDFAYHVQEINGEPISPTDALEVISDFNVDDFQVLFDAWNAQKFVCDFARTIKCPECGVDDVYEFDNLTAFFPKSWNV